MDRLDPYNQYATQTAGMPAGWQWYQLEAIHGGVLVTGIVPTVFYKRGPRKGEPNFKKSDRSTLRQLFAPQEALKPLIEAAKQNRQEG